jgi:hypothetical protein
MIATDVLHRLPLRQLARHLADGAVSAQWLLDHCLTRIERINPTLNALTISTRRRLRPPPTAIGASSARASKGDGPAVARACCCTSGGRASFEARLSRLALLDDGLLVGAI